MRDFLCNVLNLSFSVLVIYCFWRFPFRVSFMLIRKQFSVDSEKHMWIRLKPYLINIDQKIFKKVKAQVPFFFVPNPELRDLKRFSFDFYLSVWWVSLFILWFMLFVLQF